MDSRAHRLSHNDYTVACICPMGVELAAVEGMLEEIHKSLPSGRDQNGYTLGRIGRHNVVVAAMPAIGTNRAASVAMQLLNDFQSIRFGLLVGIGGGVPGDEDDDIRLGDVVVSKPTATFGGVVQYDLGKVTLGGTLQRTGTLKPPSSVLMANVQRLQAQQIRSGSQIPSHLAAMVEKYPNMRKKEYVYQGKEHDQLFQATYAHCGGTTCRDCDQTKVVQRPSRYDLDPEIHYGTIGSGNAVIKDGVTRDRLRKDLGVLCVEMEAAGLMDEFSCLVIRGICDYADSHKNKRWQPYAAATAAAYMKELLYVIPAQEITQASKAADALQRTTVFSVPFPRDKHFIVRKPIFSEMEICFHDGRPVALCGMGGIGKSQIAIEYAYRFRDRHPQGHVFWVYAANQTQFTQAYRDAAKKMELPGWEDCCGKDSQMDVCQLVCEWLNEGEDVPWLVILDNADEAANFLPTEDSVLAKRSAKSAFLAGYLPKKFNHSQYLLITTRNRAIGEYLCQGQACVDVGPFSSQEAGDLLRTKVRGFHHSKVRQENKLVEILGRIPLAIAQAAAFINRNKISVVQYVEELAVNKQSFMAYLSKDLQDPRREPGFPNSVFRTWKLSFVQIQADQPRAAEALSLMAMLDGQKIPEHLVRKQDERQIDFSNAIGTLDGYSMISKDVGGKTCSIHPLVQLSVQYILEQSGQASFYRAQALQLVAKRFPCGEYENQATCESLLPHAQAVLEQSIKSDTTARFRARLLHNVGWFEWRQGRLDSAYQHLQSAYQTRKEMFGDEAGDTLDSLALLALVLQGQGKYETSEEMTRRALAGSEKVLGLEHPDTLSSVNDLALVLQNRGKYEAAEEMNRRVLAGREKVLGVEHPDTLTSLNNLALVLQGQGKWKTAEEMHRRSLAGSEKVLGLEHPDTLSSINNLASLLQDQGKYEAAEEMNRRALAGREKVLGMEHPDTLSSVNNLASVLRSQGKYRPAEEMNRRALAGNEKALGLEHPDTLTSVRNLALVLQDQGKYEAAEDISRQALTAQEKVLGVEHPSTLGSVSSFALVLRRQGKYKAAEEMSRRALAGREKLLGIEHPDTLTSLSNLAWILQNQGKYKAAEEMNRRALAGRETTLGLEHPDTLVSLNNLALLLRDEGKYKAAEEMNRLALARWEKILGVEHPHTLTSVNNLASVLQRQGKYKAAEEMNRRALTGREKVLGAENPSTLTSLSNLASVLQGQGRYKAAEEMSRRALLGWEKVLGLECLDTLSSVSNLASELRDQGRYEAAEEMDRRALLGREKILGAEHPDTMSSLSNLALVFQEQGKYEMAEEMNRQALEGQEKVLGVEHPDTLTSVSNLALILQKQGKYKVAEEMSERAMAGREKVLGAEHPDTLASVCCLANVLSHQKRFEQAATLYQTALSGYRQTLGPTHPTTLACTRRYASFLKEMEIDQSQQVC